MRQSPLLALFRCASAIASCDGRRIFITCGCKSQVSPANRFMFSDTVHVAQHEGIGQVPAFLSSQGQILFAAAWRLRSLGLAPVRSPKTSASGPSPFHSDVAAWIATSQSLLDLHLCSRQRLRNVRHAGIVTEKARRFG